MAILNMQMVSDALKTHYLPGLKYQLDEKSSPFYSMIEKTTQGVVGKDIQLVMRYGRQGGVGARPTDTSNLPTPNSRKNKLAKWETKNLFARIQISDKTIKASASNAGAFANLLEAELSDCLTDAKDNFARQLFGTGDGVMAYTGEVATTLEIPVTSTRFFYEGQLIDILNQSGPIASNREITIVDRANKKITISGAPISVGNGDSITIAGSYGAELTGLDIIMQKDTTIYGIDRSINKWLNPTVRNLNNEISELAIQEAMDNCETIGGEQTNFILTTHGVKRAYQYLMQAQKRSVNTMELKGGYKAMSYNDIPFVADKYQAEGTMDLLNTSNFKLYRMGEWDWLNKDGAVLSRMTDKPCYEASLVQYGDIACDKLVNQARITGITEH